MASPYAVGVEDLIRDAEQNPAVPLVEKLLNRGDRMLLHGYEETFKSGFALELGYSLATAKPFLGELRVPKPLRVGIVETEMRNPGLGERLKGMFPKPEELENLRFLSDAGLRAMREAKGFQERVKVVGSFLADEGCQVAIVDSAVDLFSAVMNPDGEQDVQSYFDELAKIPNVDSWIHVRHDTKPKPGGSDNNTNNLIRGSSRWKEVPETILHFTKRANSHEKVEISVGKLRYGRKPKPFSIRFDQKSNTIVPAPPVLQLLDAGEMTKQQLVSEYEARYGLHSRTLDNDLGKTRDYLITRIEDRQYIYSRKSGLHPDFIWKFNEVGEDD